MLTPESDTPVVLVIMGSVRAGRACPTIAGWVVDIARASSAMSYELVDLRDWALPMDDEPGIPARGVYANGHTRAWSEKIAHADAFVFVTPQYNWGYPAVLKNALDHLYKEWHGKPAIIVTYGGHGGTKCAAQLRQIAEAVKLHPVATMPAITLTEAMIGGSAIEPQADFAVHAEEIRKAFAELSGALQSGG
jgi:NAD(P)H-dependent FMN reductase